MKVTIVIWIMRIMLLMVESKIECSTLINDNEKFKGFITENPIKYEGRFSKIESYSEIHLLESMEALKKCI